MKEAGGRGGGGGGSGVRGVEGKGEIWQGHGNAGRGDDGRQWAQRGTGEGGAAFSPWGGNWTNLKPVFWLSCYDGNCH